MIQFQGKSVVAAIAVLMSAGASAATYYVAPNGDDNNAGTLASPWQSIAKAQSVAVPDDTIYFRGGSYIYTAAPTACTSMTATVSAITLNKPGSKGKPIRYWAFPGETPKFDFSQMTDNCRVKGFNVITSYVHLKGLEVTGAPQQPGNLLNNESWGIYIAGNNNIFEQIDTHHHMGPGLFLADGQNNLVLNVDSHHNYDPYSKSGAGQNADGFGAHMPLANKTGNVFRGCRAWSNSDDGFDLINAGAPVVIENSWAWLHGYLPGTTTSLPAGNGNGFKIGGFGGTWAPNAPVHVVRNNVAFKNKSSGFYANHHPVASQFYNNTSVANRYDFNMLGIDQSGAGIALGVLRNNLAYLGTLVQDVAGADVASNSWNLPVSVAANDFQSVSYEGWDAPRLPDGSLPPMPQFRLASGSDLVDKGVNVGLPFIGAAPDLGAFEGTTPVPLYKDVTASVKIAQSGLTLNRVTQQMTGTVSFTNMSNAIISGALLFRLDYLTDGVTLSNGTATQGGAPAIALAKSSLAPGETVSVTTTFQNPTRVIVGYKPKLFAAAP
jgi:hypothetical protein